MSTARASGAGDAAAPGDATDVAEELARLRAAIEELDDTLVRLIAERTRLARAAGVLKRGAGLPTLDPAREAAVVRRAGEAARREGVADDDVRYIFWHLIGLSRRAQLEEA